MKEFGSFEVKISVPAAPDDREADAVCAKLDDMVESIKKRLGEIVPAKWDAKIEVNLGGELI